MRYPIPTALAALFLLVASSISAPAQPIGEVNGVPIERAEFEIRVQDEIRATLARSYSGSVNEAWVREAIWNRMIDEVLLRQTADRMGISISDEQLRNMLLEEPPEFLASSFTDSTGGFDGPQYALFITDVRGFLVEKGMSSEEAQERYELFDRYREEFRRQRLRQALQSAVTSSLVISPAEALAAYREERSRASGTIAALETSLIADEDATVTESEARAYFDGHRGEFQQKASREIRYAIFTPRPSREDSSAVEARLKEMRRSLTPGQSADTRESLYTDWVAQNGAGLWNGNTPIPLYLLDPSLQTHLKEARAGSIIGPLWLFSDGMHMVEVVAVENGEVDVVRAQHILLSNEGDEESARALAQKILKRARSGESFEKLASTYSTDPSSAAQGGDVGYFARGTMIEPFEKASFGAKPGTIVGPVRTDYGYHIIKVIDRSRKSYRLRDWKLVPRVSSSGREAARLQAERFRRAVISGGSIDEVGRQEDVEIIESGALRRNWPVAESMALVIFAYSGSMGTTSEPIHLPDGSYAIAQIAKIREVGTMEFDEAREMIMNTLREGKKLDLLKQSVTDLRAGLKPGQSLSMLAEIDSRIDVRMFEDLSPIAQTEGGALDRKLIDAIFTHPIGEASPPIRGDHGYYIIFVDRREVPTEADFAAAPAAVTDRLMQRRTEAFLRWLETQREEAVIKGGPVP